MRHILIAVAGFVVAAGVAVAIGGCSSSNGDDSTVKSGSGEVLNPSGKPKDPAQAAYSSKMEQAGEAINAARAKDAAAMAAARARAGGK